MYHAAVPAQNHGAVPALPATTAPRMRLRLVPLLVLSLALGCGGVSPFSSAPTEAVFRALLARGSGSNVAVTDVKSGDPRLQPRVLPFPAATVRGRVISAILTLPRWEIQDSSGPVIWATRTTRLWRFKDDVLVLVESQGDSSIVLARSASRVGKGDLGQNRRNLHELWRALERSQPGAAPATFGKP